MMQEKPKIRLYVAKPYTAGDTLTVADGQAHYLIHVMRVDAGDRVAVFNGSQGEWLAEVASIGKKQVTLQLIAERCQQQSVPDLWLAFAPLRGKTEWVVEKAVELGVSKLMPVFTRHAVVKSVNMERLAAHAVEAAEQCGRMDVPPIEPCPDLPTLLSLWPTHRTLLYGDESGNGTPVRHVLSGLKKGAYGVLVGPEGGFSVAEHEALKAAPFVTPFTMGPRILRADTASAASLACIQAWLGDWDEKPAFEAQA